MLSHGKGNLRLGRHHQIGASPPRSADLAQIGRASQNLDVWVELLGNLHHLLWGRAGSRKDQTARVRDSRCFEHSRLRGVPVYRSHPSPLQLRHRFMVELDDRDRTSCSSSSLLMVLPT